MIGEYLTGEAGEQCPPGPHRGHRLLVSGGAEPIVDRLAVIACEARDFTYDIFDVVRLASRPNQETGVSDLERCRRDAGDRDSGVDDHASVVAGDTCGYSDGWIVGDALRREACVVGAPAAHYGQDYARDQLIWPEVRFHEAGREAGERNLAGPSRTRQ